MTLFIICIKIFFIRILDVALGTIRTIITIKGKTWLASIVGFIEVFIWFVIVKEALNTYENSIIIAISYALGFAIGTYIGGFLSSKIIHTNLIIQIITSKADILTGILRDNNYAFSVLDIKGRNNDKKNLLLVLVNDKELFNIKKIIKDVDYNAFIFVNETKYIFNGYYRIKKEE